MRQGPKFAHTSSTGPAQVQQCPNALGEMSQQGNSQALQNGFGNRFSRESQYAVVNMLGNVNRKLSMRLIASLTSPMPKRGNVNSQDCTVLTLSEFVGGWSQQAESEHQKVAISAQTL